MLRGCAIVGGALLIAGGLVIVVAVRTAWPAGVESCIFGSLILGSIFFERRYRGRRAPADAAPWQSTGERFIDPGTGKLVEVRYNPRTGERVYRETDERSG